MELMEPHRPRRHRVTTATDSRESCSSTPLLRFAADPTVVLGGPSLNQDAARLSKLGLVGEPDPDDSEFILPGRTDGLTGGGQMSMPRSSSISGSTLGQIVINAIVWALTCAPRIEASSGWPRCSDMWFIDPRRVDDVQVVPEPDIAV